MFIVALVASFHLVTDRKQASGICVPKRDGSGQGVPQSSACGTASSWGKCLVYPQPVLPEAYSAGTIFDVSDLLMFTILRH